MAAIHGVIPGRGDRLLPAVSALLAVSAFPPFHLLVPSFVALVPLAVWVAAASKGSLFCEPSHKAVPVPAAATMKKPRSEDWTFMVETGSDRVGGPASRKKGGEL